MYSIAPNNVFAFRPTFPNSWRHFVNTPTVGSLTLVVYQLNKAFQSEHIAGRKRDENCQFSASSAGNLFYSYLCVVLGVLEPSGGDHSTRWNASRDIPSLLFSGDTGGGIGPSLAGLLITRIVEGKGSVRTVTCAAETLEGAYRLVGVALYC